MSPTERNPSSKHPSPREDEDDDDDLDFEEGTAMVSSEDLDDLDDEYDDEDLDDESESDAGAETDPGRTGDKRRPRGGSQEP